MTLKPGGDECGALAGLGVGEADLVAVDLQADRGAAVTVTPRADGREQRGQAFGERDGELRPFERLTLLARGGRGGARVRDGIDREQQQLLAKLAGEACALLRRGVLVPV